MEKEKTVIIDDTGGEKAGEIGQWGAVDVTDLLRKGANALVFPEELPPCEDPRPNVGEQLSAQDEAAIVRAAVRELPPHLRAATVFRYYEDLTIPEIALILSVPEGTVKSRLHEAKCRIRERIARTVRPDASSKDKEIKQ